MPEIGRTIQNEPATPEASPNPEPSSSGSHEPEGEALQAAEALGYVPEAKWHGKPELRKTYERWRKDYDESLPIIKRQRDQTQQELAQIRAELAATQQTQAQLIGGVIADANRKLAEAVKVQEARYAEAIASLDAGAIAKARSDLRQAERQLEKSEDQQASMQQQAQRAAAQPAQEPDFIRNWKAANPWYGNDAASTGLADGIAREIQASMGLKGPAGLEELDRRMRAERPQLFEREKGGNRVEGGTRSGTNTGLRWTEDEIKGTVNERLLVGKGKPYKAVKDLVKAWNEKGVEKPT